jgi:tetratricopeptide (TPR) repeat protein
MYSQNRVADSLKLVLKTSIPDSLRCSTLNQLVDNTDENEWPLFNQQMGDLAKKNLIDSKEGSYKKKLFSRYLSAYYSNIGFLEHGKANLINAMENYEKALIISKSIGDVSGEATHCNNIGYVYMDQGNISKALDNFTKTLKLFEKTGDKKGVASALNNIGYIYDNQGDKLLAKEYYLKCIKIKEEINDIQGLGASLNNLGIVYKEEGNSELALSYLLKSLKIRKEGYDKSGIANTMNNIGALYLHLGNAKKALAIHEESLELSKSIGDKDGISATLIFLGNVYFELKMPDKAIAAGEKSMEIAKEIGFPEKIKHAADLLVSAYELKGDYDNTLKNYELFVLMSDSIKNKETQKAAIRSQFKIEYEGKEQAAKAEQEKKDLKAAEEKQKQIIIRNSFVGGFALVLILALVIYRSFLQNKRKNKLIEAQKTLVEEKQKEILASIQYAGRIQTALMPSELYLKSTMNRLKN